MERRAIVILFTTRRARIGSPSGILLEKRQPYRSAVLAAIQAQLRREGDRQPN